MRITHLYQFVLNDGVKIFMREKPPDEIKTSLFAEAPPGVCAYFEDEAMEQFHAITGRHLHSIADKPGATNYLLLGKRRDDA